SFEFVLLKELPSHILALEFNSILLMMRAHKALYSADFLHSLFRTKMDFFCQSSERAFQILPLFNLDSGSLHFFQSLPGTEPLSEILKRVPTANHEMLFRVFYLLETLRLIEWRTAPSKDRFNEIPKADFKKTFESEKELPAEIAKSLQAEYMDLMNKDYFSILEASPDSSDADLEESYRATRYRLHPDRFGQNIGGQTKRILDDMLARIDRAYQTLMDPEAKDAYMASISRWKQDSLADSKKFLEAQDFFREGLRHLSNQEFELARSLFQKAHQKWDRGIEYHLYLIFSELKLAIRSKDQAQIDKLIANLKNESQLHRTMDTCFLLLGHAYVAVDKLDLAKDAYQIALKNNEKNEEAVSALARLAEAELKQKKFSNALNRSKAGLKNMLLIILLAGGIFALWIQRDKWLHQEDGIDALDVKDIQEIMPALTLLQKFSVAKIVLQEKWIQDVPDSVLNHKCVDLLKRYKGRGILEFYIYEEKVGLKAYCTGESLKRY
ncbi:MAG: hypothetical protein JWQ35_843, partial [Bacteriovoracaceae bacterium]|nr:hypothetical protein [Bacteriovoracaceae bacterium]